MPREHYEATEQYDCPIQRLLSTILQSSLKEAAKGDREILAWIYHDPQPNHGYRFSFDQLCFFLRIDSDILIEGLEKQPEKILNAKKQRSQTTQYLK